MAREPGKTALIVPVGEGTDQDGEEAAITLSPSVPSTETQLATLMAQFQQTQQLLVQMGVGRISADGSFTLGRQAEMRKQRDAIGSDCTCTQCTPWNQLHWLCFVCGSGPHEWRTRAPRTQRTMVSTGNKPGIRHAVCSDRCGRDYMESLGRVPSGEPQLEQVPIDKLPRAGGDDAYGFQEIGLS